MKKLVVIIVFIIFPFIIFGQIVNIPDPVFKARLLSHTVVIDTNGDGEIQESEAAALIDPLLVFSPNGDPNRIQDLMGLGAFTNISSLAAFDNNITNVDLTNNTQLENIGLNLNQLQSIDVSLLENLKLLLLQSNQLSTIDVSNNLELFHLGISFNPINTLNVSNNALLQYLFSAGCNLSEIDVSNNIALLSLNLGSNDISILNVENNILLTSIEAPNTLITSLNLSNQVNLEKIRVNANDNLI